MRIACFVLIAGSLASTSCSGLVAASGTALEGLTTREAVREAFGEPRASGECDGQRYEEFTTRRKLADVPAVMGLLMYGVATGGLSEFVFLPAELAVTGKRTIIGQRLLFTYDEEGRVTSVTRDGAWRDYHRRLPTPSDIPSGNGDTDFRKRGAERLQVRLGDRDGERP